MRLVQMTVRVLPIYLGSGLLTLCLDLMILASIFSWAFIVITIMAVQRGLGSHIEVVLHRGQQNLVEYAQIVWISSIFYNSCLGFIKTSVLALYARLGDPNLRRLALIMIAVVGCQASANVLTCIFQCNPIAAAWDLSITKKTCVNINAFYLANAALNIVTDLLAYALPIKLVVKLQMPFRQKVVLCVMMFLGLLYVLYLSIMQICRIRRNLDINPNLHRLQCLYFVHRADNLHPRNACQPRRHLGHQRCHVLVCYRDKHWYPCRVYSHIQGHCQALRPTPRRGVQLRLQFSPLSG